MEIIKYWYRGINNEKIFVNIVSQEDFLNLKDIVEGNLLPVPYFEQAAKSILFSKDNLMSYPKTMESLRSIDDRLIGEGSYNGLTESAKATLLIEEFNSGNSVQSSENKKGKK